MTMRFLRRIKLRSERGMALPLAILVMATTGAMLVTVVEYSSSSGRTAQISKSRVSAYSLAEAGIASALSELNNAVDPKTASTLAGPCPSPNNAAMPAPVSLNGGTYTYWGCIDATYLWSITSIGSVPNPTGGAALTRTITRKAQVHGMNDGSSVSEWSRMYHDSTSSCLTIEDVTIPTSIASRGDMCLVGSAKVTGATTTVEVGDDVLMWNEDDYANSSRPAGAGSGWTSSGSIFTSNGVSASTTVASTKHGTLVNGSSYTTGQSGQAVNLDGSNDYVSLPTGIVAGLTDFTVATWVRLDTTAAWERLFDFGTGTNTYMYLAPRSGTGTVRFAITTSGGGGEQAINGTSGLPTGSWAHVAVTKSGNTGRLYVNGVQVGSNTGMTLGPSSLGNTTNNWIGRSQYGADGYLDGRVDDFRIYNRALTLAEIQAMGNPSGLFAQYTFEGNANDSTGTGGPSALLQATGFGFAIPANSEITGIEAWVERRASVADVLDDNEVYLQKAGAQVGSNRASGTDYEDFDQTQYYGDDDDLWGTTWTVDEINASDFGLRFRVESTTPTARTAYVDYITIRVTYLPPPTTSIGVSGTNVLEAHVGDRCYYAVQPGSTPCSAADKVYASTIGTNPGGLNKPQIDMAFWYLNAKPGPRQNCTTGSFPGGFDNDTTRNGSLLWGWNPPQSEITPVGSSYTCQVRDAQNKLLGELSWNHTLHELKIHGTIFVDGDFRFDDNGQVVHYLGRGIIYAYGDIEFDELVCAGGTGTTSCVTQPGGMSNWDPSANMMTVLAGDDSEFDQGSTQDQSPSTPSGLQGVIYAVDDCTVHENFHLSGPIICDRIALTSASNGWPTYYAWPPLGSLTEGQAYGDPNTSDDFVVTAGDQLG